ncbi:MAG: MerR family transcriptional regulator [Oscillospiraceae bacterium]|nr:MerR family transcriptional regulator [Oscillospiraceae bacterium]
MQEFSIGDIMKITGLSRATILYYEQKELIHPRQDRDSRYRFYSIEDLTQIMFYQNMKQMEISVSDYAEAMDGSERYTDVEMMLSLKKQAYLKKIGAEMAMVRYWDQALSFMHILKGNGLFCIEQSSHPAWTLNLSQPKKNSREAIAHWDDFFYQRNLCYFFSRERLAAGDYTFDRGLSCYADCALELTPEIRQGLHYKSPRRCLSITLPFDFKEEDFAPVFEKVDRLLRERQLRINADPWGNFTIRDDRGQGDVNNLFLWIPVEDA